MQLLFQLNGALYFERRNSSIPLQCLIYIYFLIEETVFQSRKMEKTLEAGENDTTALPPFLAYSMNGEAKVIIPFHEKIIIIISINQRVTGYSRCFEPLTKLRLKEWSPI